MVEVGAADVSELGRGVGKRQQRSGSRHRGVLIGSSYRPFHTEVPCRILWLSPQSSAELDITLLAELIVTAVKGGFGGRSLSS